MDEIHINTQISLAASYYNDGRYSSAENVLNGIIKHNNNRLNDRARVADMTFCKAMSTSGATTHTKNRCSLEDQNNLLWDRVIEAQVAYRSALVDEFRVKIVGLSGKVRRDVAMEYASCLIMCAIKEVHISLRIGNLDNVFLSFSSLLRCAAEWIDDKRVMTMNEAVMRILSSPLKASSKRHHREAVKQLTHTLSVLSLVEDSFTGYKAEPATKKSRLDTNMNNTHDQRCNAYDDINETEQDLTTIELLLHILHKQNLNKESSIYRKIVNLNETDPSNYVIRRLCVLLSAHSRLKDNNGETDYRYGISNLKALAQNDFIASQVLGCLFAVKKEYSLALKYFQKALELVVHQNQLSDSFDELVLNTAQCFRALGDDEPAIELLLSILQDNKMMIEHVTLYKAIQLSISDGRVAKIVPHKVRLLADHKSIKWQLFKSACCVGDWKTCSAVTESLMLSQHNGAFEASFAHIFSLLQNRCSRAALEILEATVIMKHERYMLIELGKQMYLVDALICTEQGFRDEQLSNYESVASVLVSFAQSFTNRYSTSSKHDLKAMIMNNLAILQVLQGNTMDAMMALQEAILYADQDKASKVVLCASFNLALIMWKDNNYVESAYIWMRCRGKGELLEKARRGSLEDTKSFYQECISRYSLLRAKYNEDVPTLIFNCERLNEIQVAAMDVLILNYIIRAFRKNAAPSR